MKRGLLLVIVAVLALGACGSTRVVRLPPRLATPSSGEKDIPVAPGRCRRGSVCPKPSPYTPASGCGVERWAVKTMTDPGANAVRLTPVDTTVAALVALRAPLSPTDRVAPVETTVWRIQAHLDAFKAEADSDIHLAVHDDAGHAMIVEFPSPSCDQGSVVGAQIKAARAAFVSKYGQPGSSYQTITGDATIAGVGFFDRVHGQRAVAPNGIELHPALAFTAKGG